MINLLFFTDITERTRLTRPTIQKYIDNGTFPKPFKIGIRWAWKEETIDQWIEEQIPVEGSVN